MNTLNWLKTLQIELLSFSTKRLSKSESQPRRCFDCWPPTSWQLAFGAARSRFLLGRLSAPVLHFSAVKTHGRTNMTGAWMALKGPSRRPLGDATPRGKDKWLTKMDISGI